MKRPVRPAEEIYNGKRFRPKAFPSWADESNQCAQDDKERCSCVAFPAETSSYPDVFGEFKLFSREKNAGSALRWSRSLLPWEETEVSAAPAATPAPAVASSPPLRQRS
jgi:hypothetical protein